METRSPLWPLACVGLQAMSCCPSSDWNPNQKLNLEGLQAMTRCPGSDWTCLHKLSFEGLQAMTRCPGSDWTHTPKTSFGGLKTMSHCPGSDWNSAQKLSFEGCLANFASMQAFDHRPLWLLWSSYSSSTKWSVLVRKVRQQPNWWAHMCPTPLAVHGGAATWSLSTCIRRISRFSTTATATGDFSDDGVNSSPPTRRKGQGFYSHQAKGL